MIPLEVEAGPTQDSDECSETSGEDDGHHHHEVSTSSEQRDVLSPQGEHHQQHYHGLDVDDEEEEEFEEAMGLLGTSTSRKHPALLEEETARGRVTSWQAWRWWLLTMGVAAIVSHFLGHGESQWEAGHASEHLPPMYKCPSQRSKNINVVRDPPTVVVDPNTTSTYGYDVLKENRKGWTEEQIAPYILRSDVDSADNRVSVLELGSHSMGLNLVQTLEILEKLQATNEHPTQFWIYGNDRAPFRSSFTFFHQDDALRRLPHVELGILCAAEDSPPQDLSYLPTDTFDMVYTGRFPPLEDPLGFGGSPADRAYRYQSLCTPDGVRTGNKDDISFKTTAQEAQEVQEQWALKWVTDMMRVARPGGLIVIENLSVPYCESQEDLGGVSQDWWSTLVQEHHEAWQVDPTSLHMKIDGLRSWRYHVAMRRKQTNESRTGDD